MIISEGYACDLIDADSVAWKLYEKPDLKIKMLESFGNRIFSRKKLDRRKLGDIVFEDAAALNLLNSIIRPPLVKELTKMIASSKREIVILDAALLLDWTLAAKCDLLIGVLSHNDLSLERLEKKGIDFSRANRMLSLQRSEREFRDTCKVIVENYADLKRLTEQAKIIWANHILPVISKR